MQTHVYLSIAGENRIAIYTFDVSNGGIELQENINVTGSPGPLAVSPCGNYLYAGLRSSREIASFALMKRRNTSHTYGQFPWMRIRVILLRTKLEVSCSPPITVQVRLPFHAIGDDKTVQGDPIQTVETDIHAHCVETDASNRYAFVPHTNPRNAIYQFYFDEKTGMLKQNIIGNLNPGAPIGPRHFCFHPSKPILYFSTKMDRVFRRTRFKKTETTLEY